MGRFSGQGNRASCCPFALQASLSKDTYCSLWQKQQALEPTPSVFFGGSCPRMVAILCWSPGLLQPLPLPHLPHALPCPGANSCSDKLFTQPALKWRAWLMTALPPSLEWAVLGSYWNKKKNQFLFKLAWCFQASSSARRGKKSGKKAWFIVLQKTAFAEEEELPSQSTKEKLESPTCFFLWGMGLPDFPQKKSGL